MMTFLHRLKTPRALFALIVIAYTVYAGAFIYRTSALVEAKSFIPETRRYYVLFDDAMISMRYARNLANGDGLVWNPGGARVEGYTNPAWVGYMALFHLLDIHESKISLAIQVSAAVFLLVNLFVIRRVGDFLQPHPPTPSPFHGEGEFRAHASIPPLHNVERGLGGEANLIGLGAALFTAFYLPLNTWSLQGGEVGVLTLIVSAATLWALRALAADRFSPWPYVLLGFSTWIRMDMAVPMGALAGFLVLNDPKHRAHHLITAPLILLVFMGPQIGLRRWYYGEWLPNTYTLKMAGYPVALRFLHGFEIAWRFVVRWGVLPFGIFLFRRDRGVRLLAWMVLVQMLYSIYVGGDAWEHYGGANRYLSVAIPLWFVLLWLTLVAFYRWLRDSARRTESGLTPGGARVALAVAAGALFCSYNYTYGIGAFEEWLLIRPSLYADENGQRVEMALFLEALTTEDATVAIAGAGIIPYFVDRPYVDLLGKNDPVIAHRPADRTAIPEFKPGHMKWDYAYSIGELQPDVVLELWVQPETADPYLNPAYHTIWFPPKNGSVWMLKDSPRIHWASIFGE